MWESAVAPVERFVCRLRFAAPIDVHFVGHIRIAVFGVAGCAVSLWRHMLTPCVPASIGHVAGARDVLESSDAVAAELVRRY